MIRTPLRRLTPLRRSEPKRSAPLARTSAPKRRARPKVDRVDPRERSIVINRDRRCFISRVDDQHQCRDQWGDPHAASDLLRLTVDHFWHVAGGVKGDRAPSDRYHMVAMCHGGNVGAPSRAIREAERSYIRTLYPDWEVTDDPA